ncbi:leucine-rich repeat domain-containing protein [Babesia caballi]|uniref:Leucine-rich repeat domain-containing protein n=1 Tax=Babesia caballi TaxID=5871 RepID=A0AAV4LP52_BABCB|nr:leucine-rich repeat domain-containing protein [Babesia caballi]
MILNLRGQQLANLLDPAVVETMKGLGVTYNDVKVLHVARCGLTSLEGLDKFVNLESLDASSNNIDSFGPLGKLNKLRTVKLRENRIESLCVRRAGETTVITTLDEADVPTVEVDAAHYTLLNLEANRISRIVAEPGASITAECVLLAGNVVDDVSGLAAFTGITTLDLTGSASVDAEALLNIPFGSGFRLFLQECVITNEHCLLELLDRDEEAEVIAPEAISAEHPRMVKIATLNLSKLLQKEFVDYESEFADFRFAGDVMPCELKTPREYSEIKIDHSHFVVRTQCPSKHIETISTMVDLGDAMKHDCKRLENADVSSLVGSEAGSPLSINTMTTSGNSDDTPSLHYMESDETFCTGQNKHRDALTSRTKAIAEAWAETMKRDLYAQYAPVPDTVLAPADPAA